MTVTVCGEIDFSNADAVADDIRGAIAEWSPPTVWIDLKDATFIDSTGLGALIEGYRAATAGATRFVVVNPTAAFRRVLTVTGLRELSGWPSTSRRPAAKSPARKPPGPGTSEQAERRNRYGEAQAQVPGKRKSIHHTEKTTPVGGDGGRP